VRWLILTHRYLGIGVGWLMLLWCLSGIVMIYAPFPRVDSRTRIERLDPIDWQGVRALVDAMPDTASQVSRFQLEMLAGSPVLRLWAPESAVRVLQVRPAPGKLPIDAEQALRVATGFAANRPPMDQAPVVQLIEYDQWTVGGARSDRPLYRVAMRDESRTWVYISSRTGQVVQSATAWDRFWGWLGPVPHWLYPTILRSRPQAWSQVLIWTSTLGVFLTAVGLFLGFKALLPSLQGGRLSPFKGLMLWHHITGLLFGVLALAWVLSGLFSMNPWGLMESGDASEARARLSGTSPSGEDIRGLLLALSTNAPSDIRSVESAPLNGQLFVIADQGRGTRIRYDAKGEISGLGADDLGRAAQRVAGEGATWKILEHEDGYHYSMPRETVLLPVVQARSATGDYYYLDPLSASLVNRADPGERSYRWWHSALHRWDVNPILRSPAARNLLMLPALLGTSLLAGLGTYAAIRRVRGTSDL
jgi:hypothetical protein